MFALVNTGNLLIYKYILKAHIGPFFFALSILIFLFLFQFIMRTIEQLVGKGLSLWVITQLIVLNLAWIVTLAVPMAVLVSTLMAFGSMASSNEITIMRASGISLYKLMAPVVIVSIILTYLMVVFNNDVLPEANHRAKILLGDISRTKPTFFLEPGKFTEELTGTKILVKKTFENSNRLEDIFIFDYTQPNVRNLIIAKSGDIGFTSDFKNIVMNLENGEIHQLNNVDFAEKYRRLEFSKHRLIFDAEGFGFQTSSENAFIRGDRELSANAMRYMVDSLNKIIYQNKEYAYKDISGIVKKFSEYNFPDTAAVIKIPLNSQDTSMILYKRLMGVSAQMKSTGAFAYQVEEQVDSLLVEIYKKYSIPFACIIFAFIGAPLGYRVKRGGFGIAAGLSLAFFLFYWIGLIGGEKLADRNLLSPFLGMWLINIILGIFGLYLIFKSS